MWHIIGGKPEKIGSVRVRDVSRTGVSFTSVTRIKPGSQFCLSFPRIDDRPLLIGYQSSHCRSVGERIFSVGAILLWIGAPPVQSGKTQGTPEATAEVGRISHAILG